MSMECEFCHNKLKNKYCLNLHKKTAKYCLALRGANTEYKCELCNKNYTERRNLEKHQEKCRLTAEYGSDLLTTFKKIKQENERLKRIIDDQSKIIEQQAKTIENIAIKGVTKSSVTNINILNLMQSLTTEHCKENVQYLTEDHVIRGAEGLSQYISEFPAKGTVFLSDSSRRVFSYKDSSGKLIKDANGTKLLRKFFKYLRPKAEDFITCHRDRLEQEKNQINIDSDIENLFSRLMNLNKIQQGIFKISKGEEHELKAEINNQLCQILPKLSSLSPDLDSIQSSDEI